MSQDKSTKKIKEDKPTYSRALGLDGVVIGLRGDTISREFLISTLLGLMVVVGIKYIESLMVLLGLVAGVFLFYYLETNRKKKLSIMGSGKLSYYTETLDKKVVKIKHYNREGVKRELFSFGIANIIALEILGIAVILVPNTTYGILVTIGGITSYLVVVVGLMKWYNGKVESELEKTILTLNSGLTVTLTNEEKMKLKKQLGVDNTLFEMAPDTKEEHENKKEDVTTTEGSVKDTKEDEVLYIYTDGVLTTEEGYDTIKGSDWIPKGVKELTIEEVPEVNADQPNVEDDGDEVVGYVEVSEELTTEEPEESEDDIASGNEKDIEVLDEGDSDDDILESITVLSDVVETVKNQKL